MTEREQKLFDFLAQEDGMCVSAGGPPWRELAPQSVAGERAVTLDLSGVAPAARPGLVAKLQALVREAATTPPSGSAS